jgi:hypothetical protein
MATKPDREIHDCPTYWFVLLEAARRRKRFAEAAKARSELERLGVQIKYIRRARHVAKEA